MTSKYIYNIGLRWHDPTYEVGTDEWFKQNIRFATSGATVPVVFRYMVGAAKPPYPGAMYLVNADPSKAVPNPYYAGNPAIVTIAAKAYYWIEDVRGNVVAQSEMYISAPNDKEVGVSSLSLVIPAPYDVNAIYLMKVKIVARTSVDAQPTISNTISQAFTLAKGKYYGAIPPPSQQQTTRTSTTPSQSQNRGTTPTGQQGSSTATPSQTATTTPTTKQWEEHITTVIVLAVIAMISIALGIIAVKS